MRVIATKTSLMPQSPPQPPKRRPRGVTRHKRRETARLVRSVLDAGLTVRGIETDPVTGVLRVLVGKDGEPTSAKAGAEGADELPRQR
jgi:hypothetical protein